MTWHQELSARVWRFFALTVMTLIFCTGSPSAYAASQSWTINSHRALSADFNGDGSLDLLVQARSTSVASAILWSGDSNDAWLIPNGHLGIGWTTASVTPLIGDFNADGRSDVLLQSKAGGASYVLLADAYGRLSAIQQSIPSGYLGFGFSAASHELVVGDFNGDRRDDIFLQGLTDAFPHGIVLSDSAGRLASVSQSWTGLLNNVDWSAKAHQITAGNFVGDARDELVLAPKSKPVLIGYDVPFIVPHVSTPLLRLFTTTTAGQIGAEVAGWFSGSWEDAWLAGLRQAWINGESDIFSADLNRDGVDELLVGPGLDGAMVSLVAAGQTLQFQQNLAAVTDAHAEDTLAQAYGNSLRISSGAGVSPATLIGATAGEFRVDESGASTYSVPLAVAPGSGGVAPQLNLNYSSQGGNGVLGQGWSLGGLSTISRCRQTYEQDGQNRGITFTNEDRFCLDGQRLVLVAGNYGAAGAEYRTEINSFTRIRSNGVAGNGPASFTVWRKDGSVSQYGATPDSFINANNDGVAAPTALAWAQNRFQDNVGNYIDYTYWKDPASAEFVISEIRYTGNLVTGLAPYAKVNFIYDNTRLDNTLGYLSGARLLSRHRLLNVTTSVDGQELRQYRLSYDTDFSASSASRLLSVQECRGRSCLPVTSFTWSTPSNAMTSSADQGGGIPNVESAKPADVNGDGRQDLIALTNDGRFRQFAVGISSGSRLSHFQQSTLGSGDGYQNSWHVIDYNGDGCSDLMFLNREHSNWRVALSNCTDGVSPKTALIDTGVARTDQHADAQLIDINGDGLADLLYPAAGKLKVSYLIKQNVAGRPYRFDTNAKDVSFSYETSTPSGGTISLRNPDFKDVQAFDANGDGHADLLVKYTTTTVIDDPDDPYPDCPRCSIPLLPDVSTMSSMLSPASKRQKRVDYRYVSETELKKIELPSMSDRSAVRLSPVQPMTVSSQSNWYIFTSDGNGNYNQYYKAGLSNLAGKDIKILDINSDGLADLIFKSGEAGWGVWHNTGAGYKYTQTVTGTLNPDHLQFGDTNNDGYVDLLYPSNDAWKTYLTHLGSKAGFGGAIRLPNHAGTLTTDKNFLLDINGDGFQDHLRLASNKQYVGIYSQPFKPRNMITEIKNGMGALTRMVYEPMTYSTVYTPNQKRDAAQQYWGRCQSVSGASCSAVFDMIAPMYLTRRVYSSAPHAADPAALASVDYHYMGMKLQAGGRGSLGFAAVQTFDPQNNVMTTTTYRQDFPYTGSPLSTVREVPGYPAPTPPPPPPPGGYDPCEEYPGDCMPPIRCRPSKPDCERTYPQFAPVNAGRLNSASFAASASMTSALAAPFTPAGKLLSTAVNTYTYLGAAGAEGRFPYLNASTETSYELNGSLQKTVSTNIVQDATGNVTAMSVTTAGNNETFTKTTQNSYVDTIDGNRWFLGRLTRSVVTNQRPGQSAQQRVSGFGYSPTNGLLTSEVVEPDDANFTLRTDYAHDYYGNRVASTVSGKGITSRSTSVAYDSRGRFPLSSTNAAGHVEQVSYDPVLGVAIQKVSANGIVSTVQHDIIGRERVQKFADGTQSVVESFRCGADNCPAGAVLRVRSQATGKPEKWAYSDLLGRTLKERAQGFDGRWIESETEYDLLGRVTRSSQAHFAGDAVYWNVVNSYDLLGRPTMSTAPDGSVTRIDYQGLTTVTTNALGQTKTEIRNVNGEVVQVNDATGQPVRYGYDAGGNLASVTDPKGNVITMTYDRLGRKIAMNDPDKGRWTYRYNVLGQLTGQTDAKLQRTEMSYDLLGRMRTRQDFLANNSRESYSEWEYDDGGAAARALGKLTRENHYEGTVLTLQRVHRFDGLGRPHSSVVNVNGKTYTLSTGYDSQGRVATTTDALGGVLKNSYNARGFATGLTDGGSGVRVWAPEAINAQGQIQVERYGNNAYSYRQYHAATGTLAQIDTYTGLGGRIQQHLYSFDFIGNLKSRQLQNGNYAALRETFEYDALNRLRFARTVGGSTLEVRYDETGNILYKSDIGSYAYGGVNAKPHAVMSTSGVKAASYAYDANGNMLSGDGRVLEYTSFDLPKKVSKGSLITEFRYGPDRQRYQRIDTAADGKKTQTWYIGGVEIVEKANEVLGKRYLGGVAVFTQALTAAHVSNGTPVRINYLHKDHLGSTDVITDQTGAIVQQFSFDAFGKQRSVANWSALVNPSIPLNHSGSAIIARGYTGHEHMDEMGLIHMNGRIYDPSLGRFVQADPEIQEPFNLQNLNRYSYVVNNPLSYTDPSGYFFKKLWNKIRPFVGMIVAAIATVYCGCGPVIIGMISGAAGAAANGGNIIQGAVMGAFTGAITLGAGTLAQGMNTYATIAIQATAGGITSVVQGGKFGHGFVSAGVVSYMGGTSFIKGMSDIAAGKIFAQAIIGGTASRITGGKFQNGAMTGAMQAAVATLSSELSEPGDNDKYANKRPDVAKKAMAEANGALSDIKGEKFATRDEAALAWADRVVPVGEKYDTELVSKIFGNAKDGYVVGEAFSDGAICSTGICSVSLGGAPGASRYSGFVHNHPMPSQIGFYSLSGGDSTTAINAYNLNNFMFKSKLDFTAYAAYRNGVVVALDVPSVSQRFVRMHNE